MKSMLLKVAKLKGITTSELNSLLYICKMKWGVGGGRTKEEEK